MMFKPTRMAAALGVAAAACLMVGTSADAAVHRRLTVRMMKQPMLYPAHVRAGYVGAPGYAYGPPGPIRPMLVDIPPAGFFTPAGFIQTPIGFVTTGLTDVPNIVPGVIGIGTGLTTSVVGAGTGLLGGGVGYIVPPVR